jgi:hypothetical protein
VHVLRPVREVQEQLGRRGHLAVAVVEQELADPAAQRGTARLLCEQRLAADARGEQPRLRALAAALDAFEGHEHRLIVVQRDRPRLTRRAHRA